MDIRISLLESCYVLSEVSPRGNNSVATRSGDLCLYVPPPPPSPSLVSLFVHVASAPFWIFGLSGGKAHPPPPLTLTLPPLSIHPHP